MAELARLHGLPLDHSPATRPARSRPALFADVLPDQPLPPLRPRGLGWYGRELARLAFIAAVVWVFSAFLWGWR